MGGDRIHIPRRSVVHKRSALSQHIAYTPPIRFCNDSHRAALQRCSLVSYDSIVLFHSYHFLSHRGLDCNGILGIFLSPQVPAIRELGIAPASGCIPAATHAPKLYFAERWYLPTKLLMPDKIVRITSQLPGASAAHIVPSLYLYIARTRSAATRSCSTTGVSNKLTRDVWRYVHLPGAHNLPHCCAPLPRVTFSCQE